jgi:hypothetical protein
MLNIESRYGSYDWCFLSYSCNENLKRDGKQFYQYQYNEQLPRTLLYSW